MHIKHLDFLQVFFKIAPKNEQWDINYFHVVLNGFIEILYIQKHLADGAKYYLLLRFIKLCTQSSCQHNKLDQSVVIFLGRREMCKYNS